MFILIIIILILILLVKILYIYCKVSTGLCETSRHLIGNVVIVTGGSSGIGFETAVDLAERGARIIIASNEKDGVSAKAKIVERSGNSDVCFSYIDLSSLESVRSFANNILSNEKRLDVLINNAGAFNMQQTKTEDELLIGMQVNYFGPFLLTNLLLPLLIKTAPSRIINVSSMIYQYGRIDLEDLNMESWQGYSAKIFTYINAKLCIALMTVELDCRLQGTGVTANFLHPGCVKTNIVKATIILKILNLFMKYFLKTPRTAAQTSIHLAVSPDVQNVSGCYFVDCCVRQICEKVQNKELARDLWIVTEKLVNLHEYNYAVYL